MPPSVYEVAGRIPNEYHKLADGSLCLASRLRLAAAIRTRPTLLEFFEDFVISYLYRYAYYEKFKKDPWPDLKHGLSGLVRDYSKLLGVPAGESCLSYLELLGLRKRVANKRPCPCGSGARVGRCHYRRLNPMRERLSLVPRDQLLREYQMLAAATAREGV